MTGADLSATSKPWDLQMVTVKTIYEEFYNQGDREIIAGRQPVPIMNRIYIDQQALHQVGTIDACHILATYHIPPYLCMFSHKFENDLLTCWINISLS